MRQPETTPRTPMTLVDFVREYLEREIVEGRLRPGEKMLEQVIADRLNVSRAPVREAFRILEREGLLQYHHRRGYWVRAFSREELMDLYIVRADLEALAMRLAVPKFRPETDEVFKELMADMKQAVEKEDHQAYFSANLALHRLIYETAANRVVQPLIETLGKQVLLYRATSLRLAGRMEESYRYHVKIARAVLTRDAVKAAQLSADLILKSGERLAREVTAENARHEAPA